LFSQHWVGKEPSSHLFQRVASFLPKRYVLYVANRGRIVLISFREWLHSYKKIIAPLNMGAVEVLISFREWLHSYWIWSTFTSNQMVEVLISFREWLHSYNMGATLALFFIYFVLISFREWLHSYLKCWNDYLFQKGSLFSSLSESGFIPTGYGKISKFNATHRCSHLFQRVASFLLT